MLVASLPSTFLTVLLKHCVILVDQKTIQIKAVILNNTNKSCYPKCLKGKVKVVI